jgi:hypothetical protein
MRCIGVVRRGVAARRLKERVAGKEACFIGEVAYGKTAA